MRVLLVQPPVVLHRSDIAQFGHPIGLAYIASVLREHGHEVQIFDCIILDQRGRKEGELVHIGLDWHTIEEKMSEYAPEVVGISSMFSSQARCVHQVAKVTKGIDHNIVTIVGGAHPSALPQEMLEDDNIDYVVIGEGEKTALHLVEYLQGGYDLEKIDGIGYRRDGEVIIKPKTNFIENLDELPFPAWDLLEMERYAELKIAYGPLVKNTPFFSITASRGCPLNCMFCTVHSVWGHKWRPRSPKNVVDEIEALKKNYGINEIYFVDDNLLLNRKRMEEICDEIIQRKLDISWGTPNGVNINDVEQGLLEKMKRAGCFFLCFGIESGNEYIRNKVIRKPIRIDHAKQVVKWCRDLNIWTSSCFIIGLPGENEQTFRETIDLAKELNMDSSSFFTSRLVPGTELWRLCQERGYVEKNPDDKAIATMHMIRTESFSPKDLEVWQQRAFREFARHVLKRELLRFNMLKRLLRVRSLNELKMLYRIVTRFYKRLSAIS